MYTHFLQAVVLSRWQLPWLAWFQATAIFSEFAANAKIWIPDLREDLTVFGLSFLQGLSAGKYQWVSSHGRSLVLQNHHHFLVSHIPLAWRMLWAWSLRHSSFGPLDFIVFVALSLMANDMGTAGNIHFPTESKCKKWTFDHTAGYFRVRSNNMSLLLDLE